MKDVVSQDAYERLLEEYGDLKIEHEEMLDALQDFFSAFEFLRTLKSLPMNRTKESIAESMQKFDVLKEKLKYD